MKINKKIIIAAVIIFILAVSVVIANTIINNKKEEHVNKLLSSVLNNKYSYDKVSVLNNLVIFNNFSYKNFHAEELFVHNYNSEKISLEARYMIMDNVSIQNIRVYDLDKNSLNNSVTDRRKLRFELRGMEISGIKNTSVDNLYVDLNLDNTTGEILAKNLIYESYNLEDFTFTFNKNHIDMKAVLKTFDLEFSSPFKNCATTGKGLLCNDGKLKYTDKGYVEYLKNNKKLESFLNSFVYNHLTSINEKAFIEKELPQFIETPGVIEIHGSKLFINGAEGTLTLKNTYKDTEWHLWFTKLGSFFQ